MPIPNVKILKTKSLRKLALILNSRNIALTISINIVFSLCKIGGPIYIGQNSLNDLHVIPYKTLSMKTKIYIDNKLQPLKFKHKCVALQEFNSVWCISSSGNLALYLRKIQSATIVVLVEDIQIINTCLILNIV